VTRPNTWNEAAASIVELLGRTTAAIPSSPDALENIVSRLRPWVASKDWADTFTPEVLLHAIGREACGHLKAIDAWDINEMVSLLVGKQADYGHDNINRFGMVGLIVRISDKVARLANLYRKNTSPKNESVLDTWRDLVGYSVIGEMLADNTFNLELENTNG